MPHLLCQLLCLLCLLLLSALHSTHGFQLRSSNHLVDGPQKTARSPRAKFAQDSDDSSSDRRIFLHSLGSSVFIGSLFSNINNNAWAAIDVSGLRVEGESGGGNTNLNPNGSLANQLKAYDGSGSTRVRDVQALQRQQQQQQELPSSPAVRSTATTTTTTEEDSNTIATWAYRANPGFNPTLTRVGALGNYYRYNDAIQAPKGSKRRSIGVQLEFPSDWLQLDRTIGGIQYVDQRNGDKLYVFRATLPQDTTLETLPKATIGNMIFDPQGSLAKSGQTIEEYKVSRAQLLSDCPDQKMCAPRRRFQLQYATVTGNGLRVERRALVDAYQVETDIYMLMTSSNAVKFQQKDSLERETVERIVSSFQVDV